MNINYNDIWREGNEYHYIYHTKRGVFLFKKPIHIRFVSKYPHYNLGDIMWMLEYTKQNDEFINRIKNCKENWCDKIDIKIGTLEAKTANNVNMSQSGLNIACDKGEELRELWSKETGISYPDLEMPKRSLL